MNFVGFLEGQKRCESAPKSKLMLKNTAYMHVWVCCVGLCGFKKVFGQISRFIS